MSATRTSAPLAPQLQAVHAELDRLGGEVRALAADADELRFHRHPEPGAWSAADCVAHLTLTNSLYLPQFDAAIARGRAEGTMGDGPFRESWIGRWAIGNTEPPPRRRLPAPTRMRPRATVNTTPRDQLVSEFLDMQAELQRRLAAANGLDLGRIKMSSPLLRIARMTLFDWLGLLAAHERRHVWQARRALERP
jgi:hypothetical protein